MSSILSRLFKSKVATNSFWIIGEQMFQMVVSFVIGIISARYLGPSNYGALNYTASFVTFFTSIATLGMEGVVIKKIIEHPDKEGEFLGSSMLFRAISSVLSSFAIVLIVWVLNPNENLKVVLASLQTLQLVFTSVHILDSWFQRHLNSKYVSIAKMIACLIVSAYKVFLLITAKDIRWFAFSNTLTSLVIAIILWCVYDSKKSQKLSVNISSGMYLLKDSYHFILSGIMVAIYGQMDKIMLGGMISDTSVGFYTTAAMLCSAWTFIPNAIINSFRPKVMELKESGNERAYLIRLEQVYSLVIWGSLLASVLICALGYLIITILYGVEYSGAITPLRILIWCETFAMIGNARGIWILCENKNKYVKYYLGLGAVINLILNAALIPILDASGAAIATLITQVFTSMIAPLFFKETRIHTKLVIDAFLLRWRFKPDNIG